MAARPRDGKGGWSKDDGPALRRGNGWSEYAGAFHGVPGAYQGPTRGVAGGAPGDAPGAHLGRTRGVTGTMRIDGPNTRGGVRHYLNGRAGTDWRAFLHHGSGRVGSIDERFVVTMVAEGPPLLTSGVRHHGNGRVSPFIHERLTAPS